MYLSLVPCIIKVLCCLCHYATYTTEWPKREDSVKALGLQKCLVLAALIIGK